MPILRANILSGPLASIPSRPVSSTVVRKERVNFLFVWIHFHASGKSISPSHAFFQWLVPDMRSSLCAGSLNLCFPLPGALSGSHPSASRASHASGFMSSEWPSLTSMVTSSVPSELSLPHWTLFFFFFLPQLKLLQRSVWGLSPVIQWLRPCLAVQGMQVWFLIRELRSHISWSNKACPPQLQSPWAAKKTQHSQNK